MKNLPRLFAFCLLACAFSFGACHRGAVPTSPAPTASPVTASEPAPGKVPPPVYVVASLKKTGCYGNCPVFEAKIFSDGTATYFGEKHTPRTGYFTAKVRPSATNELVKRAESVGFFGLENQYPTDGRRVADFPTTTIHIRTGQKERSVEDHFDAPLSLQGFEQFFLELIEELNWEASR